MIGDTPYGDAKFAEFPSLVALINGDPKVDLVAHIGDIKAGKNSLCSDDYFGRVRTLFDGFQDPLVYTPGDNEWTDCHVASKNNGLYTPTERLHAVRALFFPVAGQTLGGHKKQVLTQADDPANSAYVENVIWMESQVVFATVNITGSNNDLASWGSLLPANAGNYPSQAQEFAARARIQSPLDVLRSATSVNAELVNQAGQIGTIAAGALADVIGVSGNPLDDLRILAEPERFLKLVIKGGRIIVDRVSGRIQ